MKLRSTFKHYYQLFSKIISEKKDKPFFKGGIGSFLIKFGNTALTFGLGVVLARTMGAEAFGVYTFIYAIIRLIAIPTQLGLPNLLVRYIAKYQVEERWGNINAILRFTNVIVGVTSLSIMLLSFGLLYFEIIEFETAKYYTFLWGLALLPVIALGAIRGAALRGFRMIVLGLVPETLVKPLLFITFVLMIFWVNDGNVSAANGMMMNFIASLLAYILGAYWLLKYLPDKVKTSNPDYKIKEWLHVAWPFFLTGGVQIIMGKIDIVLLGLLTDARAVGIYEVAYKGAALVSFSIGAFNYVLAPYFSRYFNNNQLKGLQNIATASVVINSVLALCIALTLTVFGEVILNFIFGYEFIDGYMVLVILSFSHLINVATGSVALLMNMTGYERKVLIGMTIASISNVILNLILIPIFEIEGAAITSLVTTAIWNLWLLNISIKKIKINPSILSIYRYVK